MNFIARHSFSVFVTSSFQRTNHSCIAHHCTAHELFSHTMPKVKATVLSKVPDMEVLSDAYSDESVKDDFAETTKGEVVTDPTIAALDSLNDLLQNPQDFLHTILLPPSQGDETDIETNELYRKQTDALRSTSKTLFSRLEKIAQMMERVENKQNNVEIDEHEDESPLSGLSELYTNDVDGADNSEVDAIAIDAETIWGQVDIQNTALVSKITKNIRKLSKRTDNTAADGDYQIRLLNMEELNSDEEGNPEMDSDSEMADSDSDDSNNKDESESEEEDDDAKRVRERMERAMEAMESDHDSKGNESDDSNVEKDDEDEIIVDPVREEMNDGFFDLHEMEAFADEEEEMLPNEAFGEPAPEDSETMEDRKKNLPHLRGRAGNDGEEEDEDFNEIEKLMEPTARRKKYRDDEDINVLATLYAEIDEDGDSDEEDAVNLSAADYFGQPKEPSKDYLRKVKEEKQKKTTINNDSDADSWDDHNFKEEGDNWRDDDDGKVEDEDEDEEMDNNTSNNKDAEESGEDEENERGSAAEISKLSAYAERSNKLEAMTKNLEKEALAEKPWQMLGESSSKKRPENSLLENTPEFEFATKMAPVITQEHTESIEETIKRRVLAEDWDDVVPRELPDIGLKRNGELPEVSQEKSKLSLGELYEREYLKKATGFDKDAVEKETEEEKARSEMKMLFTNICSKLDALSNYHFAPRPVADEVDVKTTKTPAIAMEEVLPLHVSDARAMAPEEIYGKKKGRDAILRGESEMDQVSLLGVFKLLLKLALLSPRFSILKV